MVDDLEFSIEEIPDADDVFMRAHEMHFSNGVLRPGVFRAHQGSMSVNWSKFASAAVTKQQTKNPEKNAVVSLLVGGVRKIKNLDVKHTPVADNRAHSEIVLPNNNEDLTEVRVLLLRLAVIVIPLERPLLQ